MGEWSCMMRIHTLQHVCFEGLGCIADYFKARDAQFSKTLMSADPSFPGVESIDGLIIMGGPMSVYESQQYPWLTQEQKFIEAVMKANKPIVGVCLGAQLIASVLGAAVKKNAHKEIGWFPLTPTDEHPIAQQLPRSTPVFHWHGDTFDLPQGALKLASSEACANQGFIASDRWLGLQCHLEVTPILVQSLIERCRTDLTADQPYIQTPVEMLSHVHYHQDANKSMFALLDQLPWNYDQQKMAPQAGLEPATQRLTAACSTD